MLAIGAQQVRAVTHLDVSRAEIEEAIAVFRQVVQG
jgi:threonine aldolase